MNGTSEFDNASIEMVESNALALNWPYRSLAILAINLMQAVTLAGINTLLKGALFLRGVPYTATFPRVPDPAKKPLHGNRSQA